MAYPFGLLTGRLRTYRRRWAKSRGSVKTARRSGRVGRAVLTEHGVGEPTVHQRPAHFRHQADWGDLPLHAGPALPPADSEQAEPM
jgi:hypothetical protein